MLGAAAVPPQLVGQFTYSPDGMTMTWTEAPNVFGLSPGIYAVTLRGAGAPAITSQNVALDGDPKQLPSGDGTPGGDFSFVLRVG